MKIEWILTNRRQIQVSGWLTRRHTTVALDKVQEVNYSQRFFSRHLFHTMDLSLETAATTGTTTVRFVAADDPLRDDIEKAIHQLHQLPPGESSSPATAQQPRA